MASLALAALSIDSIDTTAPVVSAYEVLEGVVVKPKNMVAGCVTASAFFVLGAVDSKLQV
jgi:hypothetical protein